MDKEVVDQSQSAPSELNSAATDLSYRPSLDAIRRGRMESAQRVDQELKRLRKDLPRGDQRMRRVIVGPTEFKDGLAPDQIVR